MGILGCGELTLYSLYTNQPIDKTPRLGLSQEVRVGEPGRILNEDGSFFLTAVMSPPSY